MNLARRVADFVYRDLYYTIGYGTLVGIGNGMASAEHGERFDHGFGEGFVNNAKLGVFVNTVYPLAFSQFRKTKHFQAYAQLWNVAVNAGFLAWHTYMGTENPFSAILPAVVLGAVMTAKQVGEIKRQDLEERVLTCTGVQN